MKQEFRLPLGVGGLFTCLIRCPKNFWAFPPTSVQLNQIHLCGCNLSFEGHILKKIKNLKSSNDVPVIILSDSDSEKYKAECYAHGASSFIKKPQTVEATARKIETFFKYWLTVVEV